MIENRIHHTASMYKSFAEEETFHNIKDYRYHDFPNTEFSYFLTIDTRQ